MKAHEKKTNKNRLKNRKNAMALETIVTAIIVLIVLVVVVVLIVMFVGNSKSTGENITSTKNCQKEFSGTLKYACNKTEHMVGVGTKWENANLGQVCCVKNK